MFTINIQYIATVPHISLEVCVWGATYNFRFYLNLDSYYYR